MTIEEEYITNELKQNYEVISMPHSFAVLDKSTKRNYYIVDFLAYMADIYTKSNPIAVVIGNWFREQSDILAKDLNEEIRKIDFSTKTTLEHLEDLKAHFDQPKNKGKFNEYFINGHFYDYHKITNIKPVLDEIVLNLKQTEDIEDIVAKFNLTEPENIIKYIRDYLVENYMLRFVNPILQDFFNQLVVTPGPRGWDWKVTWVGHGELNRDKMRLYFYNQSETIMKLIYAKYKEWFDQETYEASIRRTEKML